MSGDRELFHWEGPDFDIINMYQILCKGPFVIYGTSYCQAQVKIKQSEAKGSEK